MRITPKPKSMQARLGALGIAAGLAVSATASLAGVATLNITGFSATANAPGTYVWTDDSASFQSYSMTALNAGGLSGAATNNYSASDLNPGLPKTASVSNATATGNLIQFTDPLTAFVTAGFNLSATSVLGGHFPVPALPNSANATAQQSGGAFMLLDGNGNQTAGSITFDIYYNLNVSNLVGRLPANYAESLINLLASDDAGESANLSDSLYSFSSPGGVGTTLGHFSWTANLGASDAAYYTLSGTAFASSDVPEPGALALVSLALLTMVGASRKRSQTDFKTA